MTRFDIDRIRADRRALGIPDYVPFPWEERDTWEQRFGIGAQDGDGYDWQGFTFQAGQVYSTWRREANIWRTERATPEDI